MSKKFGDLKGSELKTPTPPYMAYPKPLKFRYFCEACTGRAMYSEEPMKFISIVCRKCGATLQYKPENWLPMAEGEVVE